MPFTKTSVISICKHITHRSTQTYMYYISQHVARAEVIQSLGTSMFSHAQEIFRVFYHFQHKRTRTHMIKLIHKFPNEFQIPFLYVIMNFIPLIYIYEAWLLQIDQVYIHPSLKMLCISKSGPKLLGLKDQIYDPSFTMTLTTGIACHCLHMFLALIIPIGAGQKWQ